MHLAQYIIVASVVNEGAWHNLDKYGSTVGGK